MGTAGEHENDLRGNRRCDVGRGTSGFLAKRTAAGRRCDEQGSIHAASERGDACCTAPESGSELGIEQRAAPEPSSGTSRRSAPGESACTDHGALEELRLPPVPEILETERAFAAEAVDPRWSAETEAHILGEIAQVTGLKLVTLQVECKTTLCRLHVAQQELRNGPSPILEIVARLGMKTRWVVSTQDRNGVPASLAYLERGSAAPGGPTAGVDDIEIRRSKAE